MLTHASMHAESKAAAAKKQSAIALGGPPEDKKFKRIEEQNNDLPKFEDD